MFVYIQDNIDQLVCSVSTVVITVTIAPLLLVDRPFGLERLFAGPGRA